MQQMFGIPFYHSKIDNNSFNKEDIIQKIIQNYEIDPKRNRWDNSKSSATNMHSSFKDNSNHKFDTINFSELELLYQKEIQNFIISYFKDDIKFAFKISNYNCMGEDQLMREHQHSNSDFSAVHYLKFNNSIHSPTMYINPANWSKFTKLVFSRNLLDNLHTKPDFLNVSWANEFANLPISENDFVITPSLLRHYVPKNISKHLRITIVMNIVLLP